MRIIFMGTPEFAVASLDAIAKSKHEIAAVVTVPDKKAGRGKKIRFSAVKEYALENNFKVLQPVKLKDSTFLSELESLKADVFVVVAFRMLPKEVWAMPPKGTFNIHASLLPQYRGAAPINHAIINGETKTGLSSFMIDEKIDTGRIILQKEISIEPEDNIGDLHDKLMDLSRPTVIETLDLIESGNLELIPQQKYIANETDLKPAPKIFKEDCHLKYSHQVEKAHLWVRGLSPYPAAFVIWQSPEGKELFVKIYKSRIVEAESEVGKIYTDNKTSLALGFENGRLEIEELQLQSKKRVAIQDFLRGFDINGDWLWK